MMLDFKFLEVKEMNFENQVLACTFTHFGQYKAEALLTPEHVFSIALPGRTRTALDKVWQILNVNLIGK